MKQSLLLYAVMLAALAPFAEAQQSEEPPPLVPPGYRLVHGDILVRQSREKSVFRAGQTSFWPGGTVPYVFSGNVSAANRTNMLNAMAVWTNVATVRFQPRNGEANYVLIQSNTGNNSAVGVQGGEQVINIASWESTYTIVHELGHCLGYWHTQSRNDRESFFRVNWANIQSGRGDNFQIEADQRHWGPYDFDSLMHYDQCSFSIDCPLGTTCGCTNTVIDVLPPNQAWQSRIGQRDHLSYLDGLVMSFLYPRSQWRWLDSSYSDLPQTGAFFTPWRTFADARNGLPVAGTLWIAPGNYTVGSTLGTAMTLEAPLGAVTLGN